MIVGRWYVQLAAIWHWYLPLCIYITFVLYCICPFLFFNFSPGIDKLDGMVDDTSMPCLMSSFNWGNMEGTDSSKICV